MKKLLLLITILFLTGCNTKATYYTHNMFYMDTYMYVKLYNVDKNESEDLFKKIEDVYKEYNNLSDRYKSYDNIINVYYLNNELDVNSSIEIDSKLYDLIQRGIDAYDYTNGKFNIALGNVIDVWKNYRDSGTGIPTIKELENSGSININDIVLENNTYKKLSDVKIDLGAIAKGYATEKAGEMLEDLGYSNYIINAGGNVKVGSHYNNSKYSIGLEDPTNDLNIYKVIYANNVSVVTSGSYERFYEYNGKRYHHIIDPNTLFPPSYSLSVSVVSKDSGYSDILSTYLFLMPIEDGIKYIDSLDNVEAIWYSNDGTLYYSKGFSKYEQE